jgi:hypothetical protein
MNLNLLKPTKAVESAFEKPNIVIALALVLLPALGSIAGKMVFGLPAGNSAVYFIVTGYIRFFVFALVAFALSLILNSKAAKGKLLGLFSALSLTQAIALAIIILSVLTAPLWLSPEAMGAIANAAQSPDPHVQYQLISDFVEGNSNAVNVPVLSLFLLASLALLILAVYVTYLSIKKTAECRTLAAILLTLIAFTIVGLLPI